MTAPTRTAYRAQLRAAELVGIPYLDGMENCLSGTRGRVQELIDQFDCQRKAYCSARGLVCRKHVVTRNDRATSERIDKLAREVAQEWVRFVGAQVHADLAESPKAGALAIELPRVRSRRCRSIVSDSLLSG